MRAETLYLITTKAVEFIAALAMIGGIGVLFLRMRKMPEWDGFLEAQAVQLVVVTMALPIILILSLEGKLDPSAIAVLVGVSLGYVLSHVGRFRPRNPNPPE